MKRGGRVIFSGIISVVLANVSSGAVIPVGEKGATVSKSPVAARKQRLSEQLGDIRQEVISLQRDLLQGFRLRQQAKGQIQKIRSLMSLQKRERTLGQQRLQELEKTVTELEVRRSLLMEKVETQRQAVRTRVRALMNEPEYLKSPLVLDEKSASDTVVRRVIDGLARSSIREIEELRVDLADAEKLEDQISQERQQLAYLFQDLKEQESLLELNEQIQVDLLKKEHQARVAQLEGYRRLKGAESQVEQMIREFNARRELEQMEEHERATARAARAIEDKVFAKLKGSLTLPVDGRIVSKFGRFLDPLSKLYVFKKGVDIGASARAVVRSVAAGKVAFSGELPNYGKVLILDHGDHFYTLCGNLGEASRKAGDSVGLGDVLGASNGDGSPVYFEIRSRNIAVNPLQWVSSSFSLNP